MTTNLASVSLSPVTRALLVLVLTRSTRRWLLERDPKALDQAFRALLDERPELLPPCEVCGGRTVHVTEALGGPGPTHRAMYGDHHYTYPETATMKTPVVEWREK